MGSGAGQRERVCGLTQFQVDAAFGFGTTRAMIADDLDDLVE
jgi:hypothetical protein